MGQQDRLAINLKLDWRMLALLVVAVVVLALGAPALGADDAPPLDVNSSELQRSIGSAREALPDREEPPAVVCDVDLVATVNGECIPRDVVGAHPQRSKSEAVQATGTSGGRRVYLTDTNYGSTGALDACASGYHMASFWEIVDTTSLIYATEQPDAYTKADGGVGPPSDWYGRVHTGGSSSSTDAAGVGNCSLWTSEVNTDHGSFVRLGNAWDGSPTSISPWEADSFNCSLVGPVWCIAE